MRGAARPAAGRPRSEAAHRAILDAVIALIGEGESLANLAMEAVAAKAGVGKATIYRRWPNKEEMLLEALGATLRPLPCLAGPLPARGHARRPQGDRGPEEELPAADLQRPLLCGAAGRRPAQSELHAALQGRDHRAPPAIFFTLFAARVEAGRAASRRGPGGTARDAGDAGHSEADPHAARRSLSRRLHREAGRHRPRRRARRRAG